MYLFMYPTVPPSTWLQFTLSPSVTVNETSPEINEGRVHIAETKYLSRKNGAEEARDSELAWARRLAAESEERADGTVPRYVFLKI